jgi:thiamine biosynthesis lipoprotein
MAATGSPRRRLRVLGAAALVVLLAAPGAWRWYVSRQSRIYERSALAMGTFINLRAVGPHAPAGLRAAMAEIERLDALFAYDAVGSEVYRLNAAAGQGAVALAPDTIAILEVALRYAEASGGRFDPTIGPLVDAWGFRPDAEPAVPNPQTLQAALAKVNYRDLRVDAASGTAELLRPGMAVDLGGIAKGYAVDLAVKALSSAGVRSAILDVGGNIYALGLGPDGEQWRVGLQHPRKNEDLMGMLPLTDTSVATSGDYQRSFEEGGRLYHHLLDPLTGYPAEGLFAISVVSASGVDGDAASTTAFVLGPDAALAFAESMGLEAVMYTADGRIKMTPGLEGRFEAGTP